VNAIQFYVFILNFFAVLIVLELLWFLNFYCVALLGKIEKR
jgi:hypothetical protein